MTEQRRTALKELQKLDFQIREARQNIRDYDPLFEEVEEPALVLESDLGTNQTRLKEMKLEERRLELGTEEKRQRQKRLDERVGSVRNLREEAAVSAELEMVKRGLQNDEQEALHLMDQIRKVEERVAELEIAYEETSSLVEPKKKELLEQRDAARKALEAMERDRQSFADGMPANELKIYDAIRAGGRRVAVAELTLDGACGHCYGVIPLQLQNEVMHGASLIRCEGCGVILAAPEPVPEVVDEPEPVAQEAAPVEAEAAEEAPAEADEPDEGPEDDAGLEPAASASVGEPDAEETEPVEKRVPEPAAAAAAALEDEPEGASAEG